MSRWAWQLQLSWSHDPSNKCYLGKIPWSYWKKKRLLEKYLKVKVSKLGPETNCYILTCMYLMFVIWSPIQPSVLKGKLVFMVVTVETVHLRNSVQDT